MGVGRDAICSHRSLAPWSLCARFGAVQILDSNRTERYSGQRPSRSLCREPCFRPSHRGYPMAPAQEAAVEPIEEVIQEVLKMLLLCHNTTTAVELTDNQYQVVRREDFTAASPVLELWPAAAQAPLLALSLEVMNRLLNYDSGTTTTSSSGSDLVVAAAAMALLVHILCSHCWRVPMLMLTGTMTTRSSQPCLQMISDQYGATSQPPKKQF